MIRVSESKEKDIDALRNLFLKTRVMTFTWADTSQFRISDFDEATEKEYILVAFAGELLVGFVSVWAADNFIHHLYVDEQFQNQGVGTKLIQAALDRFGYPIRLKCEENNTRALRFYRQKGFVEIEKGQAGGAAYILLELDNA